MTDQPTQDAIVSQRDADLLEAITGGSFDFKVNAKRERLQMIARYRAETEAATILSELESSYPQAATRIRVDQHDW